MSMDSEDFKVPSGKKISLKDFDPGWVPDWAKKKEDEEGKKEAKEEGLGIIEANTQKLIELQELFWASHIYSLLIILQGMDAAGKDSVISHVLSGVNPQGCQVTAFKTPSEEELNHDFLWRNVKALPEKGSIGIFNRSYYEDVLIVKVRPEVLEREKLPSEVEGKQFWNQRYQDITMFERHLVRNGTVVLKFFLHVSKEEQKQRFLKRLEDPTKNWKFSATDLSERSKWADYQDAYEEMVNETSTEWAPWYIIPSDKKWVTHALISEITSVSDQETELKIPNLEQRAKRSFGNGKS